MRVSSLRLLHTADWQIGRIFTAFDGDDAAALFEARFQAVERLAALATEQKVDAVLVAGDVLDAQTVSDKTLRRLFHALERYAGPWYLLPGNHDAALAESVWTRARRLHIVPPQVQLCLEPAVQVLEGRCAVLPAPLTQRHTHTDLTAWFDGASSPEGLPRIGLAHGSVEGLLADGIDSANPIAADRAVRAQLDYLALGDWHGCRKVNERCWYSGTPEPDRFRDNDPGQALLVDIEGPQITVQPLPVARHRWLDIERSLVLPSDAEALAQELAGIDERTVLQLRLRGRLDLSGDRRLREAVEAARARARALRCDDSELQLRPSDDDLAGLTADGYVGEVLEALREGTGGESEEVRRLALQILAQTLDAARPGADA